MGGLSAAIFTAATAAAVIGAAPASAVTTITGNCAAREDVRVYACSFGSKDECRDWRKKQHAPTAANCEWNEANNHLPYWANPAGYIAATKY